jgi:hypothetical protein
MCCRDGRDETSTLKGSLTLWAGEVTAEPARRKVAKLPQLSITQLHGEIENHLRTGVAERLAKCSVRSTDPDGARTGI